MLNNFDALPEHIAVIMDGSGRWAQRRLMPRIAGHHRGVDSTRLVVRRCVELKIPVLTLFAFSSENWQRPEAEVSALMTLLQNSIELETKDLHTSNVRLRVIGDLSRLTSGLRKAIDAALELTVNNTGLQLNIALNYGGRWDLANAARNICVEVMNNRLSLADIDEVTFAKHVSLQNLPAPDLLIRTSGEQRLSNFLLWQLAYTELYFCSTLWPDFTAKDLDLALEFFAQRERRFGAINSSLQKVDNV